MPSRRTTPLPPNWKRLRLRIARRDNNTCQIDGPNCLGFCPPGSGGECDHIGAPDNHNPDNLRWVCRPCHLKRTARQAIENNPMSAPRARPDESHPGLIDEHER